MRRRSPLLVLTALLLLPATSVQAATPAASQAESGRADPAGRYIVVLKKNATLKTVRDRHAREDGTHADRSFSKVIKGFAGKLSPEQVARVLRDSERRVLKLLSRAVARLAASLTPLSGGEQ